MLFIWENIYQNAYRITNKANTTPVITITQGPSVPPTITGNLFDKAVVWRCFLVSGEANEKYTYS